MSRDERNHLSHGGGKQERSLKWRLNGQSFRHDSAQVERSISQSCEWGKGAAKGSCVDGAGESEVFLQEIKLKPQEELSGKQISEIEQAETLTNSLETFDFHGLYAYRQDKMVAGARFELTTFRL